MYLTNYNTVFADYLSVTYHPDNNPSDDLHYHLISHGYVERPTGRDQFVYEHPDGWHFGTVMIQERSNFVKLELKGMFLKHCRTTNTLDQALVILGSCPHNVTQLHLAMDISRGFPSVYRAVRRRYPRAMLSLIVLVLSLSSISTGYTGSLEVLLILVSDVKRYGLRFTISLSRCVMFMISMMFLGIPLV